MSPRRSTDWRPADRHVHPLHGADRRMAEIRDQALLALVAVAVAPLLVSAVAVILMVIR